MLKSKLMILIAFCLLSPTLFAAAPQNSCGIVGAQTTSRKACTKEWTVLVYMNADNSLDPFAIKDMREMLKVGSSDQVDFLIQTDLLSTTGVRRYHLPINPTNSEEWPEPVLPILDELDSGNINTLRDFALWGFTNYPSRHKMLIFWGHGMGFSGFSPDKTSDSKISIADLKALIDEFQNTQGDNPSAPLVDIYASDACLMQSIEVIWELKKDPQYFVGSANNEPGDGWPYDKIFRYLIENPTTPQMDALGGTGHTAALSLAQQIPHIFSTHYFEKQKKVTQSSIVPGNILTNVGDYSPLNAFYLFSTRLLKLIKLFPDAGLVMQGVIERTEKFGFERLGDLGHFLALTGSELYNLKLTQLDLNSAEGQRRANALDATLSTIGPLKMTLDLLKAPTTSPAAGEARLRPGVGADLERLPFSGITIWLPNARWVLDYKKSHYQTSEFLQKIRWIELLEAIHPANVVL